MGSFCHTIHLFIHPSICSTTPLPSFIHFLTGISISFHFNSFLTVLKSIPLYCYLIISSMISPLISASSEWMDSYYPSIHLDYCMHSSICPEPQINWARKKKEKKKKATIVWRIWNSELNHLPWAQRHCPHQQHCLDTVYTWLHSSAHCRHTKSSWNILQPISRLWNVQGEHYLVILAMWHISLQWYKDCILA